MNLAEKLLDFHIHSTYSDGSLSPWGITKEAKKMGIIALALTDHNTDKGLKEFRQACRKNNLLVIPFGAEIYGELPSEIRSDKENNSPDLIILGKNFKIDPFREYQKIISDYQSKVFIPESLQKLDALGFYIPKYDWIKQAKKLRGPGA